MLRLESMHLLNVHVLWCKSSNHKGGGYKKWAGLVEYVNSIRVDGYRRHNSCWNCKTTHKSMCTENMARKKFAKKLDDAVFVSLRMDGRTFHHQPVTNMTNESTRNSEYFWYPDLEREALARGWNPRGEMKNNVPWRRKDLLQVEYEVEPL